MGNNLFQVLIATAKAKVTPLVTKVKMWTSWSFIRTRLITAIRDFFSSLLNVRPRHKKDYYEIFGWLVSRRLAFAVVVVVGMMSMLYLLSVQSTLVSARTEGIKTYEYDSVLLRFAKDKVRITGDSGYLAYEGQVKDGSVNGYGTLYNPQGVVVYQGNFEKNMYQGSGTRFYDDGTLMYRGQFQENEFDGDGALYRGNGSLDYDGKFALGKKEGKGRLYDSAGNLIYTGGFSQDHLVYSEFLGKIVSEVAKAYTGRRTLYEQDEKFVVVMEDIDAMYLGQTDAQTLKNEIQVDTVLVLQNTFPAGERVCTSVAELQQYFGKADYEGNSELTMPEAVALNRVSEGQRTAWKKVDMEISSKFDDYHVVESFDETYAVYLYSFHRDGLVYTFVCPDRSGTFLFYSVEKEEGGEAE